MIIGLSSKLKRKKNLEKTKPLILITDDEEMITSIFEDGLYLEMKDQIEIEVTETSQNAIRLTKSIPYDILILDHRMPSIKGAEIAHKIRAELGPNHKTPIIFVSGYLKEAKMATETLEDIYYLPKPLIFKDLSKLIKKITG